jgi:hypothetical protein
MKFQKIIKEYARSDDFYELIALVQNEQEIIMLVFDDGSTEFVDREYYQEEGRDMFAKKRGKAVAQVFEMTAKRTMG